MLPLFLCQDGLSKSLHQSAEWLNLLHTSVIDSPAFFISGTTDPKKEFEASIKAAQTNSTYGKLKLPFECAYPARSKFLQKHGLLKLSKSCPDLNSWLKGLAAETLSVVFASYYPNNPASIFGHTFLKINTSKENKISDYAVNYLAITNETNGLIFGLKGLLGFYQGEFSVMPYFLKVNEYNHHESRDLFEYHLNLNQDEIDSLLKHLWEIGNNGFFDYYFLDDNCSYFILRLIDAARPKLKLADSFVLDVIPAETIKALYRSGVITKIDYRPSLYTEINHRLKSKGNETDNLDTLIKIEQFKKQARKKWGHKEEQNYYELLKRRSKMQERPSSYHIRPHSFPHETHSPKSFSLGGGQINKNNYAKFSFKPGVHGILEPQAGYLPFSQANLLHTTIQSFNHKQFFLGRFSLIDIITLNPHLSWDPKISWKSKIDYNRFDQSFCRACKTTHFSAAIGKTFSFTDSQIISFFLNTQASISRRLTRNWTYGVHPEVVYHLAQNYVSLESGLALLNRFDEKQIMDSMRSSSSLGIHLHKQHSLKFQFDYFSALPKNVKDRQDFSIDWILYL